MRLSSFALPAAPHAPALVRLVRATPARAVAAPRPSPLDRLAALAARREVGFFLYGALAWEMIRTALGVL